MYVKILSLESRILRTVVNPMLYSIAIESNVEPLSNFSMIFTLSSIDNTFLFLFFNFSILKFNFKSEKRTTNCKFENRSRVIMTIVIVYIIHATYHIYARVCKGIQNMRQKEKKKKILKSPADNPQTDNPQSDNRGSTVAINVQVQVHDYFLSICCFYFFYIFNDV